jgi:hypothetical protein
VEVRLGPIETGHREAGRRVHLDAAVLADARIGQKGPDALAQHVASDRADELHRATEPRQSDRDIEGRATHHRTIGALSTEIGLHQIDQRLTDDDRLHVGYCASRSGDEDGRHT